ncbi:unnamed protein product [Linum tenue]|uniref:Uncharacterized protein n=1 Tax=Linum tenue TaxID=586396 RepID=A0AAV0I8G8_9ROSI|nr:unnamed protein product [Linum tenue]
MKPAAAFLPALILLSTLASAASPPPPVLDARGHPVHSGTLYNILPAAAAAAHHGGGLTLDVIANHSHAACKLGVFQDGNPSSPGLPVKIFLAAGEEVRGPSSVPTATDVNIQFAASSTCARSTVWKLGRFDRDARKWFVVDGGERASTPGRRPPPESLFKIVKEGKNHQVLFKIVFCPSAAACKDVGIFVDGKTGYRRLALVDHGPLLVQFKKA